MTFTEAAIEVLRREGKPLHFRKLTEIAIRENLLDHVGKIPEEVMADQVAAHCRLPKPERRVLAVQPGTFALVEWDLEEDPLGLENLVEPPPVDELPYRSRERHPMPIRDAGRGGREAREPREPREKPRRREEGGERHGRRFPPPAEVAYEILAGEGQPLSLAAIAAQGAERLLMPEAFVRDTGALGAALAEDNRRRESAGRRPLFEVDGENVRLLAQPEGGERHVVLPVGTRATATELRRAGLASLRRKLRECDQGTVEHLALKLLEKAGYGDLKVAKRGREHVIFTGRKRMGIADVRHCFRVLRTGAEAARRDVQDTRRDLGNYGAQIGVVLTAGEAGREARAEAGAAGQLPVILLCGEALAEAFADAGLGCTTVAVPEIDESFFATATEVAGREEEMRRARREERDRREGREGKGERGERRDRGDRSETGERPEREAREPREQREPREPREPRPPREPREARAPRAELEDREEQEERGGEPIHAAAPSAEEAPSDGGEAMLVAVEAAVAVPAFESSPAPFPAAEPPEASEGDDGDEADEGDDGDEDEGGADEPGREGSAAGSEGGAPGPSGEARPAGEGGRKRRRRRRRRGGRGRGERREGATAGEGGAAQGGAQTGGEGSGGASTPARGDGSGGSGGEGAGGGSGGDAPAGT